MPINRTRGPARKKLPNGRGQHNRRQFPTLRSLIVAVPDGRVVDLVDPSRAMAYGPNIGGGLHSKGRYAGNEVDGVSEIQATGACQYQTFSRIAIVRRNYDPGATATISDSATTTKTGGAQWGISAGEMLLNVANTVQIGASAGAGITTGVEHVMGVTYDGSTVKFFIDGRAVGSTLNARTFTIESAATLFSRGGVSSPNEDLNGGIKLHSDFEGALPDEQMLSLTRDPAQLFASAYRDSWFASTSATLIELTAASFGWTRNPIQNRLTSTMSAPTLKINAQSIQNRSTIATTLASLKFSAQSIQNRVAATLTTAALKFVAQPITVGALATLIQLTTAAFNYSAKALQFSQRIALSAAALAFSPKAIQNRRTVTMTAATLSFITKALQNKLTIALSVASFSFIAWAINVTGAVASVVARLLTLLGVGS